MANNFAKEGILVNWTNDSGATMPAGFVIALGASGLFGVPITDILDTEVGAVQRTGVWKFTKGAEVLAQGDDYLINLTTGAYDAAGTSIGSVDEVRSGSVLVLLNNLPGSLK